MGNKRLSCIYFSATDTTRRCVESVALAIDIPVSNSINLADRNHPDLPEPDTEDIVLVAAPVYGGRIPSLVADNLQQMKGNGCKAVAMVVYGNRDYDDALLELTDIMTANGFSVVAAAAFIGQHSIFPKAGISRPDNADKEKLTEFGIMCRDILASDTNRPIAVKGNHPYKKYGGVPLHPSAKQSDCNKCGICQTLCPVDAIDANEPWKTDNDKCITCGRCINACPSSVRKYRGIKYSMTEKIFVSAFSRRKEPEFFI